MSFILVPKKGGEDVQVNGWNWRPTLVLLGSLLDDDQHERMSCQGCGGEADEELAVRIAEVTEAKLAEMEAGQRMPRDLSVTSRPWCELQDGPDVYSASYEWLQTFAAFCRRSGGFRVL